MSHFKYSKNMYIRSLHFFYQTHLNRRRENARVRVLLERDYQGLELRRMFAKLNENDVDVWVEEDNVTLEKIKKIDTLERRCLIRKR